MNRGGFQDLLNRATKLMNEQVKAGMPGYSNAAEFEKTVLAQIRVCCGDNSQALRSFHDSAFPDIVVNGFGLEVKFTTRPTWHGTGNSIFEGMRDETAREIALVYCRSDIPEVRWQWYENCIKGIRISHSPRYMIDMQGGHSFFDEIGISMDDFRQFSLRSKMEIVKDHIKKRVGDGECLWWFDEDREHTIPVNVRLYRLLDNETKSKIRAEAALILPPNFQGIKESGEI